MKEILIVAGIALVTSVFTLLGVSVGFADDLTFSIIVETAFMVASVIFALAAAFVSGKSVIDTIRDYRTVVNAHQESGGMMIVVKANIISHSILFAQAMFLVGLLWVGYRRADPLDFWTMNSSDFATVLRLLWAISLATLAVHIRIYRMKMREFWMENMRADEREAR